MTNSSRPTPTGLAGRIAASMAFLPRTLRLIWQAAPSWTLASLALLVVQGILPAATIYLSKPLIDTLSVAIATGGSSESFWNVFWLAMAMAIIFGVTELANSAGGWIRTMQGELVRDQIRGLVHEKSTEVDLAFYESSDYYDQLHRAREEADTRPLELLEHLGTLLQSAITALGLGAMLFAYGVWLPLVLLISAIPTFYVMFRHNRRYHEWWTATTADRRWANYYDIMLTDGESAAEMRLFGLGPSFRASYRTLRQRLVREQRRLASEQMLTQAATGIGSLLIGGAALIWMIWRATQGLATLGDLVLFYQVFDRGQDLVRTMLSNLGQIYANGLFLGNLFAFLDLRPQIATPADPLPAMVQREITFRDVTFCYPNSERVALDNFNLTIPAGQVVAIVGANGAGKSTLVKLLCRFYDPAGGSISFDGVDIRSMDLDALRRLVTVLFQMPLSYHATAGENIAMSDHERAQDAAAIEQAARAAGAHAVIAKLPEGYDTLLGKWFADGTDLSGGEWQRVALARAFMRRSPLVVLDEPTSFMDSWAEAEWLDRFRLLVTGRTAVIITHRFTTAMRADVIHVMDAGRIVESGNHEQLLALGGLYAQSWVAQMRDHSQDAGALTMDADGFSV